MSKKWVLPLLAVVLLVAVGGTYPWWRDHIIPAPTAKKTDDHDHAHGDETPSVKISPQARKSLGIRTAKVSPVTEPYWARVEVPGWVVERPGSCERIVAAPVEGTIESLSVIRGDIVRPGQQLFRIQILSDAIHSTQTALFKTLQELEVAQKERDRLEPLNKAGTVPPTRLVELNSQIKIHKGAIDTYRQQLKLAGFSDRELSKVELGKLVTHVEVMAPVFPPHLHDLPPDYQHEHVYEVEDLKVLLGESVKPGQPMCVLADHQQLWIEGKVFASDLPLVQRAAREGWNVRISLPDTEEGIEDVKVKTRKDWPPLPTDLKVLSLSNRVEEDHQTLSFFVPLPNPYHEYERAGKTYRIWRFRPGQRLGVTLPSAKFEDVFVLPAGAVVRQGVETFVFRENGDFFERIPVVLVHEGRDVVLVENDGSLLPGTTIAVNGAASLNFALRLQEGSEGGGHHGHDH